MKRIFYPIQIIILFFFGSGIIFSAQEEMSRETFYAFLNEFCSHLYQIQRLQDSSLSANTNLELQIRQWNDYLAQRLPQRVFVKIPVNKVSLGKAGFQRLEARIEFDFKIDIPVEYFQFENNIDAQKQFEIKTKLVEKEQKKYTNYQPTLKNIIIEAGIASKHNIVEKKGHLLLEIKMNISRGTSWLQFHDTILSFNSLKWVAEDDILWELQSLPFEDIMQRNK